MPVYGCIGFRLRRNCDFWAGAPTEIAAPAAAANFPARHRSQDGFRNRFLLSDRRRYCRPPRDRRPGRQAPPAARIRHSREIEPR